MHPLVVLVNLAGAVMLLLWAVRMVRTGVERAHAASIRGMLRGGRGGRVPMAMAGCVLAVMLQSSTAVGVLAAGFATSGTVSTSAGLAALVGADFGSALVVSVLSFDLSWLVPVLLLAGGTMFLKFEARGVRQSGRIVLGIAFVLLALQMMGHATEPLRESAALPQVVTYLGRDPLTAFAVGAAAAFVLHSSIATVLLLVTFAGGGLLPFDVGVPLVLGANLGGALVAVWLTRGMETEARRIPTGNLVVRGLGAAAGLAAVAAFAPDFAFAGASEATRLVAFHVAFNFALVIVALPFIGPVERLARLVHPSPKAVEDALYVSGETTALDPSVTGNPTLALACAKRELLRMGETLEAMYRPVADILAADTPGPVARLRTLDEEINRRHTAIKLYIAEVNRGRLSEEDARRGIDLTDFAINLEHAGDIVKTVLALAEDKAMRGMRFSDEGWSEIQSLHGRVHANMQLALNVLVSGDVESAVQLAREKEIMRKLERDSHDRHLGRLRSGNSESIETSDLHLEIVRAFKEINSLMVAVAYPILMQNGRLLESRLAPEPGRATNERHGL